MAIRIKTTGTLQIFLRAQGVACVRNRSPLPAASSADGGAAMEALKVAGGCGNGRSDEQ